VFHSLRTSLPNQRAKLGLRDGVLARFAVARPYRRGSKIGPLYAEDASCALALLAALDAPELPRPVIIDAPETNRAAVKGAKSAPSGADVRQKVEHMGV
jgi:hypothetical protein